MTRLYEIGDLSKLTLREYKKLIKTLDHEDLLGSCIAYNSLWDCTGKVCYFERFMAAENEILHRLRKGDK